MDKLIIPFAPFPYPVLLKLSTPFTGIGSKIVNAFPYIKIELKQAELDIAPERYGAIMVLLFLFYFIAFSIIGGLFALKLAPEKTLPVSLTLGGVLSFMIFIQLSVFPKIKVKKKIRDIEKNLIFAIRTILIEIRSGVSLFDAINFVAVGDYGQVSIEFKKAIEKINTGEREEAALEEMATNNPSKFFRRTLWQLLNGLKAGADISRVLAVLVDTLTKEQQLQVRKYGSDLRLLSLVYMMIGVIIPALGLTFLIILASFPQIAISEFYFWGLLIGLGVMQFMYLGIIKSKRPNLLGA